MKKALIINAYETYKGIGEGKLNKNLCQIAEKTLIKKGYQVKTTILEDEYVLEDELKKNIEADIIFVQFPVYWFSAPALYKKYIDEVYGFGYANGFLCQGDGRTRRDLNKKYGSGGLKNGAKYMLSSTWNAPKEAFNNKNQFFDDKSVDEVLISIHKTYQFFGMQALPSFSIYNIFKDNTIENDVKQFEEHIENIF